MICIDFRNNHRNVLGKTMCAVVGDNRALQLCVLFFQSTDNVLLHIDSTEGKINLGSKFLCIALCIIQDHIPDIFRNRSCHLPASIHCFRIGLALIAAAGCNCSDSKPRMVCQQGDKALTYHAGCADNADSVILHVAVSS